MLEPNDVVVILRPEIVNGETTGDFKIIQAVVGPVSMETEDMIDFASIAMMMIVLLSYVEDAGEKVAADVEKYIEEHCLDHFDQLREAIESGSTMINVPKTIH
jgi:hypothetical protein